MSRRSTIVIAAAVAAVMTGAASAHAQNRRAAAKPGETVAIQGAKVIVAPGKILDGATVVIADGVIKAVGRDVPVPGGARVVSGTGKVVSAGLIDASCRLGLVEVDAIEATIEGQFAPGRRDDAVHAAYRVIDGYNPFSAAIPVTRLAGVTLIVATPVGGLVSGSGAAMPLGRPADVRAVKSPIAMYATLGARSQANAEGNRGVALERLRELLADTEEYRRRRGNYERNQTRSFAAERLDLEALIPVVQGAVPLVVRVHRSTDIRAALRLREDWPRLRLIIEGGTEAWQVAEQLASAGVPVVLDPTSNIPGDFDRLHVRNDSAALLKKAGVTIAISTLGEWANVRVLRQYAGIAVAYGLPYADAIDAVTSAPARIFDIANRGTVEAGKVADVVLWSGDPLELSSRVEGLWIAGIEQPLTSRQGKLLERYRQIGGNEGRQSKATNHTR